MNHVQGRKNFKKENNSWQVKCASASCNPVLYKKCLAQKLMWCPYDCRAFASRIQR